MTRGSLLALLCPSAMLVLYPPCCRAPITPLCLSRSSSLCLAIAAIKACFQKCREDDKERERALRGCAFICALMIIFTSSFLWLRSCRLRVSRGASDLSRSHLLLLLLLLSRCFLYLSIAASDVGSVFDPVVFDCASFCSKYRQKPREQSRTS